MKQSEFFERVQNMAQCATQLNDQRHITIYTRQPKQNELGVPCFILWMPAATDHDKQQMRSVLRLLKRHKLAARADIDGNITNW